MFDTLGVGVTQRMAQPDFRGPEPGRPRAVRPGEGVESGAFDRQPPQDLTAEQSVLGGMLLSKDAIADVVEVLRPGDFYRPAHQTVYDCILDARAHGISFEAGPKDIEKACAEQGRIAIYIVRSGSTVAVTPGLCVYGEEIITSETIVAVNQERLNHNRAIGTLVESLAPVDTDHAPAWRAKLAAKPTHSPS